MANIDEIENKVADIYRVFEEPQSADTSVTADVRVWASYSNNYLSAAIVLEKEAPQYWLPVRQMLGQSLELALKTYIKSIDSDPSHSHNLVNLLRNCAELGYDFKDPEIAAVVHLNHFYFKDLSTDTKFKSRYPAESKEALGGVVPEASVYQAIIEKLLRGAKNNTQQ